MSTTPVTILKMKKSGHLTVDVMEPFSGTIFYSEKRPAGGQEKRRHSDPAGGTLLEYIPCADRRDQNHLLWRRYFFQRTSQIPVDFWYHVGLKTLI